MTRDELIRLAREAGGIQQSFHDRFLMYFGSLERFAALVAAREREECARVCVETGEDDSGLTHIMAFDCAAAIRARGEK